MNHRFNKNRFGNINLHHGNYHYHSGFLNHRQGHEGCLHYGNERFLTFRELQ